MSELTELSVFAQQIALEAGALLATGAFASQRTSQKGSAVDLVTDFDRRSEALLIDRLTRRCPGDLIVAEESGVHAGGATDRRWLVDPLDGTTNFAHGLPFFCVSIALEIAHELAVGVVHAPALGWTFSAVRGGGAVWNERPLVVSQTAELSQALLATGFPYDRQTSPKNNFAEFIALQKRAQGVRRVGSAALDLSMVAAGWLDGYWEMKVQPWDLGAGALLVTEAGGVVSSWSGGVFRVDDGALVATNGRIHTALVAAIA